MKVTNEEIGEITRSDNKYTNKNTKLEMDWTCNGNETRFVSKNCANVGTRREKEESSSEEKHGEERSKERDLKWSSEHGQRQRE